MTLSLYRETASDLQRKYGHSFVLLDGAVAYLSNFEPESSRKGIRVFHHTAKNPDGGYLPITKGSDHFVEIGLKAGLYNPFGKAPSSDVIWQCYSFRRGTYRQWRRGLCKDNLEIFSMLDHLLGLWGMRNYWQCALNVNVVENLLNPWYPTYDEGLESLSNGKLSVALSPYLGIMVSPTSEYGVYLVNAGNTFIGRALVDGIHVYLETQVQEVKDYVSRNKLSIPVLYRPM